MNHSGESTRNIEVIGAAIGLGGRARGTSKGPHAIRAAGLLPRLDACVSRSMDVRDHGDLVARDVVRAEGRHPGEALVREVERFSLELRAKVEEILGRGALPCVLGGDHSLGAATQAAVGRHARRHGWEAPGLIWIDAHTDSNTMESTPSGNLHGMMLAALHGLDVEGLRAIVEGGLRDPRRTVYLGARDIDDEERLIVERLGCRIITPDEIRARGVHATTAEAIAIACGSEGRFSVSFDLDSLDPRLAPGVDCIVDGGLQWEEAQEIVRMCGMQSGLLAIEVVEVNPDRDINRMTARLAVEAAALLCGC